MVAGAPIWHAGRGMGHGSAGVVFINDAHEHHWAAILRLALRLERCCWSLAMRSVLTASHLRG